MLGVDKDHPTTIVNVYAPISGVIIAQNVTNAAAAGVTFPARPPLSPSPISPTCGFFAMFMRTTCRKFALGQTAKIS